MFCVLGFMATAYLSKYIKPLPSVSSLINQQSQHEGGDSSDIRVSLTFEQQKIVSSTCSECKNDVWCSHIIASIMFRIKNPTQVSMCSRTKHSRWHHSTFISL